MEKVTLKTLLLAAAILNPSLVEGARKPGAFKDIRQLSVEQLRSTSRALNGVLHKLKVGTEKPPTKLR